MRLRLLVLLAPLLTAGLPMLQSTALFRALPGGTTLDCLQLAVWLAALRTGLAGSLWTGFWGGLWMDALLSGPLGPHLIFYTALGWLAGLVAEVQPNPQTRELALWGALTPVASGLYTFAMAAGNLAIGSVILSALAGQMLWQVVALVALANIVKR